MTKEIQKSGKRKLRNYTFEFLSIFIAVISAFALNNWNDNRKDELAETKILNEIVNGLNKDIEDIEINILGHEMGIQSNKFWRKVINQQPVKTDSLVLYYFNFSRDFIAIQNTSGYENLKSRGLELIENDSLRTAIISLYEYDYEILKLFEEEYQEMQFHTSYFNEINQQIAPHLQFDEQGNIIGLEQPVLMSEEDRKLLLSYLWKIDSNRRFILTFYNQVKEHIEDLKAKIRIENE